MANEALFAQDAARDELLVVVDMRDCQVGTATKMRTHVDGLLHRAFSVMLVREGEHGPELLVSRRAQGKYHSAGLWANSCCSHPRDGEELLDAAARRVAEELGTQPVGLRELGAFVYRAPFENGLCEYEFDHVLVARCEGDPAPDPAEVSEVRWVGADELATEVAEHPERFAAWAPNVVRMVLAAL